MSQESAPNGKPPGLLVFRAFYEAHVTAVYRFIYSKVGNREEAEDLTAQVFTKALHGVDWSRDDGTRQRWLFQVARTTVADHWRLVYRLRTTSLDDLLAGGWEGPVEIDDALPPDPGAASQVESILAHLPSNYADVLRCRFLRNYSIKETAQLLGLSEANVKVLQFRALKRASQMRIGVSLEKGAAANE